MPVEPAEGEHPMLELRNLSVGADNEGVHRDILKNVNLRVDDGRLLVLTGPNGGG